MTVKVRVRVLPLVSVALQVTVVTAGGKVAPEAGAHVTGRGPSTPSVAVGNVYVTTAPAVLVA